MSAIRYSVSCTSTHLKTIRTCRVPHNTQSTIRFIYIIAFTVIPGPPLFSLTIQLCSLFPCPVIFVTGQRLLTANQWLVQYAGAIWYIQIHRLINNYMYAWHERKTTRDLYVRVQSKSAKPHLRRQRRVYKEENEEPCRMSTVHQGFRHLRSSRESKDKKC